MMMTRSLSLLATCSLTVSSFGCDGFIGDPLPSIELIGADERVVVGSVAVCGKEMPAQLRLLTRSELDESLRHSLGLQSTLGASLLPPEPTVNGYHNSADTLQVSTPYLEQLFEVGAQAAAAVSANLAVRLPCSQTTANAACAETLAREVMPKLYRRAPIQAEIDDAMQVFHEDVTGGGTFQTAVEAMLTAMIISPSHVYRTELGHRGRLTPTEVASLLAFTFTGAPPDDALRALAAAGDALYDPEVRREEAERLLRSSAGRAHLVQFVFDWLQLNDLDRTEKAYPEFTTSLRADLRKELELFIEHALFEDDGTADALLRAPYTFANQRLAETFNYSGGGTSNSELELVATPERPGILTRAGLLATYGNPGSSSPVRRGALIRKRLLCQTLPSPPPTVDLTLDEPTGHETTRQRFTAHMSDPSCNSCHRLIDPLGFALESYDGMGRHRTQENGIPIDASGEVVATASSDGPFDDVHGFVELLANSKEVGMCLAVNFHMVGAGRSQPYEDACVPEDFAEALESGDGNIIEMAARWAALESTITRAQE